MIKLANPHGCGEWKGPWCDGDEMWTEHPEVGRMPLLLLPLLLLLLLLAGPGPGLGPAGPAPHHLLHPPEM
jgi:hypothetical protein